jgi:hypothetical protein
MRGRMDARTRGRIHARAISNCHLCQPVRRLMDWKKIAREYLYKKENKHYGVGRPDVARTQMKSFEDTTWTGAHVGH